MSYQTIVNYTKKNDGYKNNGALTVRGIMIHSTATPGIMAKEFRERFNKANLGKSVHGFIDDKYYVQCLPYNKKAGHCRYNGNNTHIGIELCEPKNWKTDKAYFEKVYANAVELAADLCKQFGLTEANIIDHAEGYKQGIASNHADVGHWFPLFGKSMNTFRADVKEKLNVAAEAEKGKKQIVKDLQRALNKDYNETLDVDGSFGKLTQAAVKRHYLKYKKGKTTTKGEFVEWVQTRLVNRGYYLGTYGVMKDGVDGSYGNATAEAIGKFQRDNKLTADKIAGLKTITKLIG